MLRIYANMGPRWRRARVHGRCTIISVTAAQQLSYFHVIYTSNLISPAISPMHPTLSRLRPVLRAMSTAKLADFSTCEISDALIKLAVPAGGLLPDINIISPSTAATDVRVCSPAYTVQMVPGSDTSAPKLSAHFVDTAPAGSVIVIDAPPGMPAPSIPNPYYVRQHLQRPKAPYGAA